MITLHTFGPSFGLPDASPFVNKALVLLKMSGLPYRVEAKFNPNGPKGKRPYMDDDSERIADSTFIRWHIERKYGFDFDKGLSERQKAVGWALEKMCEDHLYWTVTDARWLTKSNYVKGPRTFFDGMPAPLRALVRVIAPRQVKKRGIAHGMGRHSRAEIQSLAFRDLQALSDILADKPYFFGDQPTGWDATYFAFISSSLCKHFDTPIRDFAEQKPNLVAYSNRMMARYFPELYFPELYSPKLAPF